MEHNLIKISTLINSVFIDERQLNITKNPWGEEMLNGTYSKVCGKPLQNVSFIGYDFTNNGYKTLINEDWAHGVFNYPPCIGFDKPPSDHFPK